jgi:glycosyltransferase involved in cell wall biosynthesis
MWLDTNILIIPTNDWMRAPGHGHIDFIAEKLAERGHRVYAWHFDLYRNEQIKRTPKKVKLVKSRTLWIRDPALFFTLNALLQGPALFKVIRNLKIDVIINENILNGLVAFLVSNNRVLKVFDFSDYFPESASVYYTDSSQIMKKLVEAVALAVTKLNVKFSHICLAVCHSLITTVRSMDNAKPCYLLTNGADTINLGKKNQKEQQNDLNPSNNIMVIMGVIDDWLDLTTPLEALEILSNKFPELKIVIIGPWRKKDHKRHIEKLIESRGINSRVEITGYISSQRLARYLAQASCCIMPYKTDSFFSIIRLPEKLFVYSAYGKPILSTPLPEVIALGSEHIFFYHDANEFARILSVILSEECMRVELEAKAKEFAQKYDLSVLAKRLEQILSGSLQKLR